MSDRDWDRVLEVNVRAHVRAAAFLVPRWVERGSGYFVSTASAAGLLTQFGAAAYAVSKHAVVGFAEWLAITYGDDGIGVSCVCPMGVNTALLRGAARSEDATEQMIFAAITRAADVVEPELVADLTVQAVREGRFLVSPQARHWTCTDKRAPTTNVGSPTCGTTSSRCRRSPGHDHD